MLHAEDGSMHLIISTPKTNLLPGTPVFDSTGRLRGLVKTGFNNNRFDTDGDRTQSATFEVLPILKQDVRPYLTLKE
jgi:hypothetical protein